MMDDRLRLESVCVCMCVAVVVFLSSLCSAGHNGKHFCVCVLTLALIITTRTTATTKRRVSYRGKEINQKTRRFNAKACSAFASQRHSVFPDYPLVRSPICIIKTCAVSRLALIISNAAALILAVTFIRQHVYECFNTYMININQYV